MTFLLKVVQGTNVGAEIALLDGATLTLGRGDACDIVLNDAALDEKAGELEITSERVMLILPGGEQVRMEPAKVHLLGGSTAIAVGPAEGKWPALDWTTASPQADHAVIEGESRRDPTPITPSPKTHPARFRLGCLLIPLLAIGLLAGAAALWFKQPQRVKDTWANLRARFHPETEAPAAEPPPPTPAETLETLARDYHLKAEMKPGGVAHVSGDFKTRAERLHVTARVYRVSPGAMLDFADTESLTTAVEQLLALVSEGRLQLKTVKGRTAHLVGAVATEGELRRILEALSKDVPKIAKADCAGVTLGVPKEPEAKEGHAAAKAVAEAHAAEAHPEMPIVGILTAPYPCLVLRDGARVMEGARFGGFAVETITADHVVLRGPEGRFTWRP